MKQIVTVSMLLCLTSPVSADDSNYYSALQKKVKLDGFYIGGGAGLTSFWDGIFSSEEDTISNQVSSLESKHSTLKLYSGYNINRIVGVEASYANYGVVTTKDSNVQGHLSPRSISVAANVGYTFDTGLRAFAIAGLSMLDLRQSEDWFDDESYVAFRYGFGGEYQPSTVTGLTFRLAYEADVYAVAVNSIYNNSNTDNDIYISQIGSLYLGASYKF